MGKNYYTAGQMAKLAGVSLRTIRFYDSKGLLKPVSYSESGYRYYDHNSVVTLQRILMLKYLGFSLEQEAYFDCVIANHMLYHAEKQEECLGAVASALKPTVFFINPRACSGVKSSYTGALQTDPDSRNKYP